MTSIFYIENRYLPFVASSPVVEICGHKLGDVVKIQRDDRGMLHVHVKWSIGIAIDGGAKDVHLGGMKMAWPIPELEVLYEREASDE